MKGPRTGRRRKKGRQPYAAVADGVNSEPARTSAGRLRLLLPPRRRDLDDAWLRRRRLRQLPLGPLRQVRVIERADGQRPVRGLEVGFREVVRERADAAAR